MASITFSYSLEYGKSMRVGYKPKSSAGPFTYLSTYPSYADSPFTIGGIAPGTYDIELTTICSGCTGNEYSDPYLFEATTT